ncbi:MAG: hypothetical protein P8185_07555 [Deltaproteobacteria bacterium]|jgi:hypothetical protein
MKKRQACQLRPCGAAGLLGVILGFMMPLIFEAILPSPVEWLPEEFLEIRRARIELILNEIVEKVQPNPGM